MAPVTRSKRSHPVQNEQIDESPPKKRSKYCYSDDEAEGDLYIPNPSDSSSLAVPRRRNVRGRRGSLQELPNMPMDIIDEIFSHMLSGDLLTLTRTSKPFRNLLMSRESAPYWRAARRNVEGLPDCPRFLTEPEYASLCFDSFCHNCFAPNVHNVLWYFQVRYCKKCQDPDAGVMVDRARDYFGTMLPALGYKIKQDIKQHRYHAYRNSIPGMSYQLADIDAAKTEYKACKTEEEKAKWLTRRRESLEEVKKWADACDQWYKARREARSDEISHVKQTRLAAVIANLREMGWGEELDHMASAERHPLSTLQQVKQLRPLTDRAWANMKDAVVTFMQETKKLRLAMARKALFKSRISALGAASDVFRRDFGQVYPSLRELASFPEVQAIIESPAEVSITVASFDPLGELLPALVLRWQDVIKQRVLEHLRRHVTFDVSDDFDIFKMAATATFACDHPGCRLERLSTFPNILTHSCFNKPIPRDDADADWTTELDYETRVTATLTRNSWSAYYLEFPMQLVEYTIRTCGMDPSKATIEEMDEAVTRFRCVSHGCEGDHVRRLFSWRAAVEHMYCKHHYWRNEPQKLVEAKPEEAAQIAHLEVAAQKELFKHGWALHCCAHCPEQCWIDAKWKLQNHLRSRHGVDEPNDTDMILIRNGSLHNAPFYIISNKVNKRSRQVHRDAKLALKDGRAVVGKLSTYR